MEGFSALNAALIVFLIMLPDNDAAILPKLAKRDKRELGTTFSDGFLFCIGLLFGALFWGAEF